MPKISESDAMAIVKAGAPFNIQFVTADVKRASGGKRVKLNNAKIRSTAHSEHHHATITIEHSSYQHPISVHRKLIEFINEKNVIK
jgi:hypothetical protein